jgi:hypothetical protein
LDRALEIPSVCSKPEEELVRLESGCAVAEGAAFHLDLAQGVYYLELTAQGEQTTRALLSVEGEQRRTFGPLLPDTEYSLHLTRLSNFDVVPYQEAAVFVTGPPAPRFVLTEVLADPLGTEPQAEWVELLNVGSAVGSLEGLFLWDDGGGSPLSAQHLEPGQYGVIVRQDFELGPDLVPDADSVPVLVETLGGNGLRNSGEVVELRDASERIVSSIPGRQVKEGSSLARLSPWLPDVPESFAIHASPGSSPGAPNQFSPQ